MNAGGVARSHSRAVGGQRKRCQKGKNCSAACIERADLCLVEIPISAYVSKIRSRIKSVVTLSPQERDKVKESLLAVKREAKDKVPKDVILSIQRNKKAAYNKARNGVIKFNEEVIKNGLEKEVGLLNIPVTWERLQQVKKSYTKAVGTLFDDLKKASEGKNIKEYGKIERRLLEMYNRIGSRIGAKSLVTNLHGVSTSQGFSNALLSTQGLYNPLVRKAHESLAKLIGKTNRPNESKFDGIYSSLEEKMGFVKRLFGLRSELGDKGVENSIRALFKYTDDGYTDMRASQMGRSKSKTMLKLANDLEALLNSKSVDKPEIIKFRGVTLTDEKLKSLIDASKTLGGYFENATSSWSTALKEAVSFSDKGVGKWGNNRVIFETVNKKGVPIEFVTREEGEYEVVTPSKARYLHRGYTTHEHEGNTYHVFMLEEI